MATIETVDFGVYGKHQYANISTEVGQGLANERNDVLLIQTLFWLIGGAGKVFSRAFFGYDPIYLPAISGTCDGDTLNTIWSFQRHRRYRLLNVDGKIHPASYQNRVLKSGPEARQMSITLLNMNAAQIISTNDIISAIKRMTPEIVFK
jgi:hypothetical protein